MKEWGILGNLAQLQGNHAASISYTERGLEELGEDGPPDLRAKRIPPANPM